MTSGSPSMVVRVRFSQISQLASDAVWVQHGRVMKHTLARNLRFFAIVLAALLLVSTSWARAEAPPALDAKVSKVVDGDTFTLSGESRRIRVWGLDAPEWNQPGGGAATAGLRGLISGKRLHCDVLDIDRYGRLVAQCFLADGRDIAAEMIRSGAATEYCRYSRGFYGTC